MSKNNLTAAGIDLGSNTFRLLVADCTAGNMKVLVKKLATVRLGSGLTNSGILHPDSMQNGFTVLRSFRQHLDAYHPESLRICGTEALRRAKNSPDFLAQAEEILQQQIDIINGEEEARLSFTGTLAGIQEDCRGPLLVVDVGGGSTELTFARSPAEETHVASIPLGVVWLTENFFSTLQPDLQALDNLLKQTLADSLKNFALKDKGVIAVGCGGTATSMAALDLQLTSYNETLVHGHVLDRGAIIGLWEKLIVLSPETRNALPCLGDGRGEILPAGIRIYHILLKLLQLEQLRVSDTGLLEGILLSSLPDSVV